MTDKQIRKLRELEAKATKGPWEPCGCRFSIVTAQITPQETMDICDTKINDAISCEQAEANNCFISAARSAVPELLDALERSERIASNLDAVNKAIYRSMSEICGVAVDGFSDIQPVLMGLRVDADLFYSIKAENAALKARVAVLEKAKEAAK